MTYSPEIICRNAESGIDTLHFRTLPIQLTCFTLDDNYLLSSE